MSRDILNKLGRKVPRGTIDRAISTHYKFTFDGKGINDATDEYRSRIATFRTDMVDIDKKALGILFAAAPEMLAALEKIESCLSPDDNDVAALAVRAAIKKALGL